MSRARVSFLLVILSSAIAYAQPAPATSKEVLDCVEATAAAAFSPTPSLQRSVFTKLCSAPCGAFSRIAAAEPDARQRLFVTECCNAEARKLLALPIDERWPKLSRACGVPSEQAAIASFDWTLYGKVNHWLEGLTGSADPLIKAALHDIFTNSNKPGHGLYLPLAAKWIGHYQLPRAKEADVLNSYSYVLLDGGKVYVGPWPRARFSENGYLAPAFAERDVTLARLRAVVDSLHPARLLEANPSQDSLAICFRPLLLADRALPAAKIAQVTRAMGDCGVDLAIAQDGVAATHFVYLRKRATSDDHPRESGLGSPEKRERVKLTGTVADVATLLDALRTKDVRVALID